MKILNTKGQSLVEALVALGAASVVIAAIAIGVITAVNNATFSKNQNLATQYAQQGIDIVRQQSESSWVDFATRSGTFCLPMGTTELGISQVTDCDTVNIDISGGLFIRQINVTKDSCAGVGSALVSSIVFWSSGKCTDANKKYCHKTTLDTCLANINIVN